MKYSKTMLDLLRQVDENSKDLTEGKLNETGHTDVASAKNQVKIAMSALQKMEGELGKLKDEDNLPSWWTNKVAVSVDKIDGMADYLDTQVESKQVNEESMKCPRCGTMNETPFDKCSNCGLPKAEFSSYKKEEAVDPADKDVVATNDDRKAADKNIIMQLRRLQDMKGKGKAMFADKKATKINPKLIDFALKAHGKMKPQDKLKFQKDISKSYRDFLMTLKRTR